MKLHVKSWFFDCVCFLLSLKEMTLNYWHHAGEWGNCSLVKSTFVRDFLSKNAKFGQKKTIF